MSCCRHLVCISCRIIACDKLVHSMLAIVMYKFYYFIGLSAAMEVDNAEAFGPVLGMNHACMPSGGYQLQRRRYQHDIERSWHAIERSWHCKFSIHMQSYAQCIFIVELGDASCSF